MATMETHITAFSHTPRDFPRYAAVIDQEKMTLVLISTRIGAHVNCQMLIRTDRTAPRSRACACGVVVNMPIERVRSG